MVYEVLCVHYRILETIKPPLRDNNSTPLYHRDDKCYLTTVESLRKVEEQAFPRFIVRAIHYKQ